MKVRLGVRPGASCGLTTIRRGSTRSHGRLGDGDSGDDTGAILCGQEVFGARA